MSWWSVAGVAALRESTRAERVGLMLDVIQGKWVKEQLDSVTLAGNQGEEDDMQRRQSSVILVHVRFAVTRICPRALAAA